MVDFNALRNAPETECPQCGSQFTNASPVPDPKRDLCARCQFLHDHPEEADKYWTWHRYSPHWRAVATWPDGEDLPQPGDVIEINRRDGFSTINTIQEVHDATYNQDGRRRVSVTVGPLHRSDDPPILLNR